MTTIPEEKQGELKARWEEFWRDHDDFDPAWARSVLHCLAEFLPFVFDFDAVGHAIELLYVESGVEAPADFSWDRDWDVADELLPAAELRKLPIFRLALALRAYAYYGLKIEMGPQCLFSLDEFLEQGWEFFEGSSDDPEIAARVFPLEWGLDDEARQTIIAAITRWKLDQPSGVEGLKADELAALARVSRKSIMNLVAPSSRSPLRLDANGLIPLESARRWLESRSDFRRSLWQYQEGEPMAVPEVERALDGDPVFVPATEDGVCFAPFGSRTREGDYRVLKGDDEQVFDDYWQALEALNRAAVPRWRHPDAAGRFRVTTGTRWVRKTRQELEEEIRRMPPPEERSAKGKDRRKRS